MTATREVDGALVCASERVAAAVEALCLLRDREKGFFEELKA